MVDLLLKIGLLLIYFPNVFISIFFSVLVVVYKNLNVKDMAKEKFLFRTMYLKIITQHSVKSCAEKSLTKMMVIFVY